MLIELITDTVATLGVFGGAQYLYQQYWPKRKPNPTGVYTWKETNRGEKFRCPKCECRITGQPPICSCEEHHYEHFHFQCVGREPYCCGYKCIVRTIDDRV
jgi:hypothetical protein